MAATQPLPALVGIGVTFKRDKTQGCYVVRRVLENGPVLCFLCSLFLCLYACVESFTHPTALREHILKARRVHRRVCMAMSSPGTFSIKSMGLQVTFAPEEESGPKGSAL